MSGDDPFASLSPRVFGVQPPASDPPSRPLPDVLVGEVRFVGAPRFGSGHGCDADGRVPVGSGYFTGVGDYDLCPVCFEPERASSHTAPRPEDQARFARAGIGTGGDPLVVDVRIDAELDRLVALVDEHDVRRILVRRNMPLPDDDRIVLAARPAVRSESGGVKAFELQLRGLAFGPPIDPELVALLEAARDADGVIRDAELADRYHAALIEQSKALDALMERPEPVIEHGNPVFPSFADEDEPLPG
jgi:hypothetical protein